MLEVKKVQCEQCLFSKKRIVSKERMAQIIKDCLNKDMHFLCHKHKKAVCGGWFKSYTSQAIRIAGRLNMIKYID